LKSFFTLPAPKISMSKLRKVIEEEAKKIDASGYGAPVPLYIDQAPATARQP
jgi:hypothetical protein